MKTSEHHYMLSSRAIKPVTSCAYITPSCITRHSFLTSVFQSLRISEILKFHLDTSSEILKDKNVQMSKSFKEWNKRTKKRNSLLISFQVLLCIGYLQQIFSFTIDESEAEKSSESSEAFPATQNTLLPESRIWNISWWINISN